MADVRPAETPAGFAAAVRSLGGARLRAAVHVEPVRAPQRLAPYSHAVGIEVLHAQQAVATGRLVLLHDPAGHEGWQGTFRLVGYANVDLEPDLAADPLLAEVGWSWLTDSLAAAGAGWAAASGTVTQTASTRFGELAADGPVRTCELELRASWTPLDTGRLDAHLAGWAELLCTAAGLPPDGVAAL